MKTVLGSPLILHTGHLTRPVGSLMVSAHCLQMATWPQGSSMISFCRSIHTMHSRQSGTSIASSSPWSWSSTIVTLSWKRPVERFILTDWWTVNRHCDREKVISNLTVISRVGAACDHNAADWLLHCFKATLNYLRIFCIFLCQITIMLTYYMNNIKFYIIWFIWQVKSTFQSHHHAF